MPRVSNASDNLDPFLTCAAMAFGRPVCRLGLASRGQTTLTPAVVLAALEQGVNFLNWPGEADAPGGADALSEVIATLGPCRDSVVVCVQFGARTAVDARAELRSILTTLRTDFVDVLTCYYVEEAEEWRSLTGPGGAWDYLQAAKRDSVVRHLGVTSHQRPLAAAMARSGLVDVLMIRYNAAHRGAETELFPITAELHIPVIAYTALRWARSSRPLLTTHRASPCRPHPSGIASCCKRRRSASSWPPRKIRQNWVKSCKSCKPEPHCPRLHTSAWRSMALGSAAMPASSGDESMRTDVSDLFWRFSGAVQVIMVVIGHQDGPPARIFLEKLGNHRLLVRPGIGKDHIEILRSQPHFFSGAVVRGAQPGKAVAGIEANRAALRDETAPKKLDRQGEVIGQLAGLVDQVALDLDAAGVILQHGRQASDHAEAAAPFAEKVTPRDTAFGERLQDTVGLDIIAGNEPGNVTVETKAVDALVGLAQERRNVMGQMFIFNGDSQIDEWNEAPFQDVGLRDPGSPHRGPQQPRFPV